MTRRLVLPAMAGVLAVYVLVHSPALQAIGAVIGRDIERCYFACSNWAPNGRPADAASALLALLLAAGAGWLIAARLPVRGAERLLSFGLLATSFIVVPASMIGAIGWALGAAPLRPPMGPLLTAIPAALVLGTGVHGRWGRALEGRTRRRPLGLNLLLAATASCLLGASIVIALVHPPTSYDALSYHAPLSVYFWRDGNVGTALEEQIWGWALAHPGTMELWAGLLRVAAGERVANLAQLPFAALAALAVYLFARHTGLPRSLALTGGLAFLLGPLVVLQVGIQRNDLMAGALVIGAAALVAAPRDRWSVSRFALVGLALGLAATTKLSMLPAAAALALYGAIVGIRTGHGRALAAAALTFTVVVAPWWGRNLALYGNPIYPAALPFIGRGHPGVGSGGPDLTSVPAAVLWPLYPVLEPHTSWSGYGAMFAVGALPGIVAALVWRRSTALAIYGLMVSFGLPAWWFLTTHMPRFLLPLFGLGFAFVGWSLLAVPRAHRRAGAWLLGGAALFSAAVTADQGLRPLARDPTGRAEFYDRVWGVDSVAAGLADDQPLLSHTGHALLSYAADYPLLGAGGRRTLITIDGDLPSDSIITIMRERDIRYAYVPAATEAQSAVTAMYPERHFDLVHSSLVSDGERQGTRRYLFRLR